MIEKLADKIASAVVNYQELLKVSAADSENTLIVSVDVASCDVENIVGKTGCMAGHLRY